MNKTSWLIIGCTALIIIGIILFGMYPLFNNLISVYKARKDAKQELTDVTKKKEILGELSKNDKLTNIYNIASAYIPEEQNSSDLVIELTAIASQNNLSVQQLSIDSGTTNAKQGQDAEASKTNTQTATTTNSSDKKNDMSEIKFTIKLKGSFNDFENFLKGVETSSRLVSITGMNLTQEEDAFTAQVSGKAYYKKATTLENILANIEIPQTTIDKFLSLKTHGTPINLPSESGFGRTNPFEGF